jgi:hypothetical protein
MSDFNFTAAKVKSNFNFTAEVKSGTAGCGGQSESARTVAAVVVAIAGSIECGLG